MDFNDIIVWVEGLLQNLADYLLQLLQWIWNVLVLIGNFLWNVLLDIFKYAWTFLKKAGALFRSLWDNFFKKIWNAVLKAVQKAQHWLEQKLGPVIQFLQKLRKLYDRWFKNYIKPLLTFLQRLRKFIAIMKLLHIHVFDGLDKQLAKIENKITTAVLAIRGFLNNLIDLVNLIADPLNILRRPTLVYSFRRVALSLVKVFTHLPPGFFVPSPRSSAPKGTGFLPVNFTSGDATYNPVASTFLGNEGLPGDFNGFIGGVEPPDSAVDDLSMLDYFDDSLYAQPECSDPARCLQDTIDSILASNLLG